jgi:hypothetical protein
VKLQFWLRDLQKRRRKKLRKLISYVPEMFAIVYLIAYGVADNLYYATPHLADLAEQGLTTKGSWTEHSRVEISIPTTHSLEIPLKPWFRTAPPPSNDFDGYIVWSSANLRPLYPIMEDRFGGALLGIIPLVAKYAYKIVRPHGY